MTIAAVAPPSKKDQCSAEDSSSSVAAAATTAFQERSEEAVDNEAVHLVLLLSPSDYSRNETLLLPGCTTPFAPAVSFEQLNLSEHLLRGLYAHLHVQTPTKIQAETLPLILMPPHRDLISQAHDFLGKTACFVLAMLSRVDPTKKSTQALCICPSNKIALQIHALLLGIGRFTGVTSTCILIKDSPSPVPLSRRPPVTDHVLIATRESVHVFFIRKKFAVQDIKILVYDHADQMLAEETVNFKMLLSRIRDASARCQVLFFSATFNEKVKKFIREVFTDANQIYLKEKVLAIENLKQYKVWCADELAKIKVTRDRILGFGRKVGLTRTIIFVRVMAFTKMLEILLNEKGYECTAILGPLTHEEQDKVLREFRDGVTKVLIATDLLPGVFDNAQVDLVINYNLPLKDRGREPDYEAYRRRISRAGCFGRKGAVFNLLCSDLDKADIEKIEHHFKECMTEVRNWEDEADFEDAVKNAGLLATASDEDSAGF